MDWMTVLSYFLNLMLNQNEVRRSLDKALDIAAVRARAWPTKIKGRISMRTPMMAAVAVVTGVLVAGPAFAQGTWSSLKPIPQGEEEVYGTTAGGKLYVLGGLGVFPGWEPKQMLWSFDPAAG